MLSFMSSLKLGIVGGLILAILSIYWYMKHEIKEAKRDLATMTQQYNDLLSKVNDQNQAIITWKQKAQEKELKLAQLQSKAQADLKAYQSKIKTLQNAKIGPGCNEAMQWGLQQAMSMGH